MDDDQMLIQDLSSSSDSSNPILGNIAKRVDLKPASRSLRHIEQGDSIESLREAIRKLEQRVMVLEQRNTQLSGLRSTSQFNDNSQDDVSEIKSRSPAYLSGIHDDVSTDQKIVRGTRKEKTVVVSPSTRKNETPQKQEGQVSRLNLFEKRMKQHEDRVLKMSKEYDIWKRDFDKKLDIHMKRLTERHEKTESIRQDLGGRIEELGQNQKALIQHIHSMGQEIHEASVMTNTLKEEQDRQIKQAVLRIDTFESQANRNDGWIKELQTAQMSLENDILLILRNYKEMLNEVLKVQMLSEDVKHLYAMQ